MPLLMPTFATRTKKRQDHTMKRILAFAAAVLLVLALALTGGSIYMVHYALDASENHRDTTDRFAYPKKMYPEIVPWIDSLRAEGALRDTFITTPQGERHHAIYARHQQARGRTAILVHGYKDSSEGMLFIACFYHRLFGFNVLLPDLHGHGLSDGDDIQMGWKDRTDVLRWMDVAERLFRTEEGESRMVVHGISMGAATAMNVAGSTTPDYARCFVEDCGYTSAWDEFAHELDRRYHLPPFPLLHACSALCRMKYGWTFSEASPLHQVGQCHKPMLFIHGMDDDFVPTRMVFPLFKAKPSAVREDKRLVLVKGAAHAEAYRTNPKAYIKAVKAFITPYIME